MTTAHPYAAPPAGHIDDRQCIVCGYGPGRHHRSTGTNAGLAREVAENWLEGLQEKGGDVFGQLALRAVLAALNGETDPAVLGFSGLRGTLTRLPEPEPDQLPLTA